MLDGRKVDHPVRDHDVERCFLERERVDAALDELDLRKPVPISQPRRLAELLVRKVDAEDTSGLADVERRTEDICP